MITIAIIVVAIWCIVSAVTLAACIASGRADRADDRILGEPLQGSVPEPARVPETGTIVGGAVRTA